MRQIKIDFARRRSARWMAGMAMLVLSMATCGGLARFYVQAQGEVVALEADIQRFRATDRAEQDPGHLKDMGKLQEEFRLVNRVIDSLDRPWKTLFDAVESAAGPQATLLTIEPDSEQGSVQLVAEAKDFVSMLDYVDRLRAAGGLQDIVLLGHQINLQDPQQPVRFTLQSRWGERSAGDGKAVADVTQENRGMAAEATSFSGGSL